MFSEWSVDTAESVGPEFLPGIQVYHMFWRWLSTGLVEIYTLSYTLTRVNMQRLYIHMLGMIAVCGSPNLNLNPNPKRNPRARLWGTHILHSSPRVVICDPFSFTNFATNVQHWGDCTGTAVLHKTWSWTQPGLGSLREHILKASNVMLMIHSQIQTHTALWVQHFVSALQVSYHF